MAYRDSTGDGRSLVAVSDRPLAGQVDRPSAGGTGANIAVEWTEPLPERLWASPLRLCVLGSSLLGGALIAIGWAAVSATREVSEQTGGLILAIVGLGAAAVGQAVWFISGRRTLGRAMCLVLPAPAVLDDGPAIMPEVRSSHGSPLVAVQGPGRLYHRATCPFVLAKTVTGGDRESHERAGRSACAVCEP